MTEDAKTKDVSARDAIDAIRGPMTNAELMQKFKLSPQGFADLLRQLFVHKLITEEDLHKRGARYKPGKKEPEPAAAPPPPAPTPVPIYDEDYAFLDTVTLTDLLTLKPLEAPPPFQKMPEPPAQTDEQEETPESKKKKFSLGGLFKRD